jgi:hypothetical protein
MLLALGLGLALSGCKNGGDEVTPQDTNKDKRDQVTGVYHIKVTTPLGMIGDLETDMTVEKEGRNNLKGSSSATLPVIGTTVSIEVEVSEMKEFNEIDGKAVVGYYFKLPLREYDLIPGFNFMLAGSGKYGDGYDGVIWKSDTESYFAADVQNEGRKMFVTIESVDE